jgi:hypothetical protein
MKILTILIPISLLILAGCQKQTVNIDTIGQPVGEIPDRPGLIEQTTGKKLEIGIL